MAANELSLFNSSVSTVEGNMSINNDAEHVNNTEEFILARLNELRQWQESQQKSLVESQSDQKKMLELEKQKLYALLGLSANESDLHDTGACSTESSYFLPHIPSVKVDNNETTPKRSAYSNDLPIDEKPLEIHSPSMNQLQKIIENMAPKRSPRRDRIPDEPNVDIPKRPFLKRGEGLKQRFKMSPDAFRLDNLPKYKYAQRMQKHAQTTKSRKQRHHQENTTNDTIASTAGIRVGVTSEGHQNNAKEKSTQPSKHIKPMQTKKRPNPRRPNPQQLQLKPNTVQNKFKSPSDDVKKISHQYNQGRYGRCHFFHVDY